ncbi:MAG: hypothetical protein LBE62_02210 [Azonexus sp.]|jgi:hypothetical protein|nr:hypothetical protein [Azonexus sp.]
MLANGIRETTATTGTGNLTLAAVTGFPRFSAVNPAGADHLFPYSIVDDAGAPLEGGLGYLADADTLVRLMPLWTFDGSGYADAAPAPLDLPAGDKFVHLAAPWQTLRSSPLFNRQFPHATPAERAIFNALSTTFAQGANGWTAPNRMHYWPVLFDEGAVCGSFIVSGVGNAANEAFACGLYSVRADGRPGRALATSGRVTPVAAATSQAFSFTGGQLAVMPGVYFIGAMVSVNTVTFDLERNRPFLLGSTRSGAQPYQGFTENIAAGWLDAPVTAGAAIMPGAYNSGFQNHPCIGLGVAP